MVDHSICKTITLLRMEGLKRWMRPKVIRVFQKQCYEYRYENEFINHQCFKN